MFDGNSVRIYRVVSNTELEDIKCFEAFKLIESGMRVKQFCLNKYEAFDFAMALKSIDTRPTTIVSIDLNLNRVSSEKKTLSFGESDEVGGKQHQPYPALGCAL